MRKCTFWPRGYKTFFMLNSAEHEICPANKSQITNNCKFYLAKHSCAWNFFLLINMKMPTIVGIFIFISRNNFMLSWAWKSFINLGPDMCPKDSNQPVHLQRLARVFTVHIRKLCILRYPNAPAKIQTVHIAGWSIGLDEWISGKYFSYFSTKTYFVSTH